MPTLHVLIADDEYFIRQRIKKIIPWTSLNLIFAGEAENGLEVLNLLEKNTVDILILDIKMPKMTGIEVAEFIHNHHPATKVIILSGYNEFEYARTALRYGVSDYLLKPVEASTLTSTLEECIEKISKDRQQSLQLQKFHNYEKSTALADVLNGSLEYTALTQQFPEFLPAKYSLYIGCFLYAEGKNALASLLHSLAQAKFHAQHFREGEYLYIVQLFLENKQDSNHLGSVLTQFVDSQSSYVFLSVGTLFAVTEQWIPFHKRVVHGLNERYFSRNSNLLLEYAPTPEQNYSQELPKIRQTLTFYLNGKDEAGFKDYIQELFHTIEKKRSVDFLYVILSELFMTYHIHYRILEHATQSINGFVNTLLEEEYSLEVPKNLTLTYGLRCMEQNDTTPSDVALSKKIMAYVQEHYQSPDLSVTPIAEVFQLHPSYMGTVFKKVNNISVLQYITNIRMEAAKRLLESNEYKISEVAEFVGYSDVFYFSKRFKKAFGFSPKDYALKNRD